MKAVLEQTREPALCSQLEQTQFYPRTGFNEALSALGVTSTMRSGEQKGGGGGGTGKNTRKGEKG